MIDDGKNKNSGEFDDTFDDDFADTDFDEAAFDESTDYEAEYDVTDEDNSGDDFEVEDWGDGEEEPGKKSKAKKKRSGGGLSFNTIVIIGAVVVGAGVLVFNVMNATKKAESAKPSIFQSILGIGGVMDGILSGEKKEEQVASPETQPQDNQGFLGDPNAPIPAAEPPQPVPVAPVENTAAVGEPLTPMPDPAVPPSAEAPRGPDEVPPADPAVADLSSAQPAAQQSAEDILKNAMANREQKQEVAPSGVSPMPADQPAQPVQNLADANKIDAVEPVTPVSAPQDSPVQPAQATPQESAPAPVAEPAVVPAPTENKEAVTALERKLDTLLKRMDQIESELGSIREAKTDAGNAADLQKTVSDLKAEIETLKSRPITEPSRAEPASMAVTENAAPKVTAKKKKKKKATPKALSPEDQPYSPSTSATSQLSPSVKETSGQWELRAAQPGRAWVSKPGDRDMRAVSVGDSIPGVGQIGSITYSNGQWVVSGSQGTIRQ